MEIYPLQFLGPGVVVDATGHPLSIRSQKQLGLLVFFASEHQIAHRRDTLLALFWPQETTSSAQNNLRVTLSRLREVARKIGEQANEDLLRADRNSVQLDPAWVERADINGFTQLLQKTRHHAHPARNQCATCQADLLAAVQLYQDELLAGFGLDDCHAFEEWLFMQRERLHLQVLEAYVDLSIYAESNGNLKAARNFVQRQIEIDPLRESAYRQQMHILARMGERNAALTLFERCRTILSQELGLDPEPETLSLHLQLLNSEIGADANTTLPGIAAPEGVSAQYDSQQRNPPVRTNLVQQLTPFIGREEELALLHVRLANPSYRLLTIVGAGGVGKSRLAQQVAAQQISHFADGVYFVALAQLSGAESIPLAIAEALNLSFAASEQSPAQQLIQMIEDRALLLVLDNFEHLLDGTDFLVKLLQHAPKLVVVVTSREQLNLQFEDLFELQGLATPTKATTNDADSFAAVRLFVDRGQRIDKAFKTAGAELETIIKICQLVEGFPLAIELAATWLREMNCGEILNELRMGLDRLQTTLRDVAPQHRSLRAVFDSSWRLLSTVERKTLAKLSIFRAGFTLDAARTVANTSPAIVSALRNKSLLRTAGSRRYDMHSLVQQFAAEALATDTESESFTHSAHAHYYLHLLAEKKIALDTRQAGAASDIIAADWENVVAGWREASTQKDTARLLTALDGLVRFCDLRGLFYEVEALLAATLSATESPSSNPDLTNEQERKRIELRCRLLIAGIYFAECRGEYQLTESLAQAALTLADQLDNLELRIAVYLNQAKSFELIADYRKGITLAEKTLQLAQNAGLDLQAGISLELIGYNAYRLGDYARSKEIYQRLLDFHEQSGRLESPSRLAISILGQIALEEGDYELALRLSQQFLERSEATYDRINIAHAMDHLATIHCKFGNYAQAKALEEKAYEIGNFLGDRLILCQSLRGKATAHRLAREVEEAVGCAREALRLAQLDPSPMVLAFCQIQLAEALLLTTDGATNQATDDSTVWQEVEHNFGEAAKALRGLSLEKAAVQAELGLAAMAYRRGDLALALQSVLPILPLLPTTSAAGWDDPLQAYLICVRILQATAHPSAQSVLDHGLQLRELLAGKISDPQLRQSFLQAAPAV